MKRLRRAIEILKIAAGVAACLAAVILCGSVLGDEDEQDGWW